MDRVASIAIGGVTVAVVGAIGLAGFFAGLLIFGLCMFVSAIVHHTIDG